MSKIGKQAPYLDGVPVVVSTALRDAMFPSPDTNQRVQNLETGYVERYDGSVWQADIASERGGRVFNVKAYGAVGDGVADDTTAIQAAIDACVLAGGGSVYFPVGTYKVTATLTRASGLQGVQFRGDGWYYTKIDYTPTTGACFKLGTYTANISDYAGVQGCQFHGLWINGPYYAPGAAPTGTSIGIADYEGGDLQFHNCRISGFYQGVWGIASDLNDWKGLLITYCEYGLDLRSRSDQLRLHSLLGFGNFTQLRLTGVKNAYLSSCAFVENIGPDVVIEGGVASDTDPLGGGAFSSIYTESHGIELDTCWFEVFRDKNASGPWDRQTNPKECYVGIGRGADSSASTPVGLVRIINSTIEQLHPSTGPLAVDCFVRTKYCTHLVVDGVTGKSTIGVPLVITEEVSSTDTGFQFNHFGRVEVLRNNLPDVYGQYLQAEIQGGKLSPLNNQPPGAVRQSIVSNPRLRGAAIGWTLSNATKAGYSVAAGENLFGEAQTITPTAQFGSLLQNIRLSPTATASGYEVILRWKAAAGATVTGTWQLKIAPSATGAATSNLWARTLTAPATLQEFRFRIPNYSELIAAPRLYLSYLGTTLTDLIVVDYLDVQEIASVASEVRGPRRVVYAAAVPAAGAWEVGDVCINTAPSELGSAASKYTIEGWVCTVAGTPGTWLQRRALTGN